MTGNEEDAALAELKATLAAGEEYARLANEHAFGSRGPDMTKANYYATQGLLRMAIGALREHLIIHGAGSDAPTGGVDCTS